MSGFLLDTNIPSELIRSSPEPKVNAWLTAQLEASLFMSVISLGEFRRGFKLLPTGKRRVALEAWFNNDLVPRFHGRILPVTHEIADRWGVIDAEAQSQGLTIQMADGLIAATALEHGLTLVTRNTKDFTALRVSLLNPWLTG